jgi:TonB-dependent SusC/RagA subfamily outer membrane receptor
MKSKSLIISFTLLCATGLSAQEAQTASLTDTVTGHFVEQLRQYPQEKLYLQTDKPHYVSGEKVWFRAHKVDALLHWQTNTGRYVYAELISPLDSVVSRVKIHPDSLALFHGYLPLDEGLPEGNYTLRAYTRYMENQGQDYFYHKTLPVFDPLSLRFDTHAAFLFDNKDIKATFRFVDRQTGSRFIPENLTVQQNRQAEKKPSFDSDTTATLTLRTPERNTPPGTLTLTLHHDGKKYTKYIQLPSPDDDFDVAFMPEGGHLLAGANNTVAFKAINTGGLAVDVTCNVIDSRGETIRKTRSQHLGMGTFDLYPSETGEKYCVECTAGNRTRRFDLPPAVASHCGLKVKRIQNKIYVAVNPSSGYTPATPIYLLVHIRGGILYNEAWDPSKEYLIFEDAYFPSGITQFILYDADRQVISERLIFNHSAAEIPRADYTTDRDNYAAKQHIISHLKLTDTNGTPLSGNVSVAVTDDRDLTPDSSRTILTTLLLTSELAGHIENPSYYLNPDSKAATAALDLLMMTQGWRRYAIPEIIRGNLTTPSIPVEESQIITGRLDGMFTTVKDGYISILAMKDAAVNPHVVQTDRRGRFELKDIDYPDSTRFIVQAVTKKGGKHVFLEVDAPPPYPAAKSIRPPRELFPADLPGDYIAKADEKYLSENGMRTVNLAEVVVTAPKTARTESAYYSAVTSSQVITADDIDRMHYRDMKALLLQISGIMITGDQISVRGGGPPLVVIDDAPDASFDLMSMEVSDIADIFLIKDASAGAMFGTGASNGALIITTKRGFVQQRSKSHNISNFVEPLGFQAPLEFYSPRYEASQRHTMSDLRTTIYWKPDVHLSETGEATFDFYSSDAETTYTVVIEGVSSQGHLIYKKAKIRRTEKIFRP